MTESHVDLVSEREDDLLLEEEAFRSGASYEVAVQPSLGLVDADLCEADALPVPQHRAGALVVPEVAEAPAARQRADQRIQLLLKVEGDSANVILEDQRPLDVRRRGCELCPRRAVRQRAAHC